MLEYKASAGQARFPIPEEPDGVAYEPMPPIERPNPPMREAKIVGTWADEGWFIAGPQHQHFLPGVTPEMIDWFWANMEKCYYLWAPGSHKFFQWVREPWRYGFVNSAHIISENKREGAPAFWFTGEDGMYLSRLDMDVFPLDYALSHVLMEGWIDPESGEIKDNNIHMWEAVEGGTNHITMHCYNPRFLRPGITKEEFLEEENTMPPGGWHEDYECSHWPVFLPKLYSIWQGHPDPCQNVVMDLTVTEVSPGTWKYVHENGPVA